MEIVQRGSRIGLVLALCLIFFTLSSTAQDEDPITIVGSRLVVEDLLNPIIAASDVEVSTELSTTGTSSGFEAFCAGEADITGASRPLSVDEGVICDNNEIVFKEYLIGYDALALITHPELAFVECLTTNNLNTLFAPSSQGQITNWQQTLVADATDTPLSVYLPADTSADYARLDELVEGFGLRTDATIAGTDVVSIVSSTPGAIGATSLRIIGDSADVNLVQLNISDLNTCVTPSPETIDNREYTAADRLLLYVNQNAMGKAGLQELLAYTISNDASQIVAEAGFTPASETASTLNQSILAGDAETGRQFSREVVAFEIPSNVLGAINIGGTTNVVSYMNQISAALSAQYPSLTLNLNTRGEATDTPVFCDGAGGVDILAISQSLSEEEATRCADNNVEPVSFQLGSTTLVLLGNAADDYNTCLTTDQLITIWGSPSTDTVTTWNAVDGSFPETDLFTFTPPAGSARYVDLMLTPPEGIVLPLRSDATESNSSALYRATAVANAQGTITFVTWDEYLEVQEAAIEGIKTIAVDAGSGCVDPSAENINNASYPLSAPSQLTVDKNELGRPEIQSILWYIYSDENFQTLEDAGYVGLDVSQLTAIREELQTLFEEAPEATPQIPTSPAIPGEPEFNPLATPSTGVVAPALPPVGDPPPFDDTDSGPPIDN